MKKSTIIQRIENVTDFSKFRKLPQKNRTVAQSQVQKLVESFKQFGADGSTIIVIKTNAFGKKARFYIADGQHRVEAAEKTGDAMDVKVIELADDSTLNVTQYIAALNNNAKAWSTINFLNAFASNGIPEYKIMIDIKKKSKLTITDLLYIFLGNGGAKANKLFKSGNMKFENKTDSISLLANVMAVKSLIPNKAFCRRQLIQAMKGSNNYHAFSQAIIKAVENGADFSENEKDFRTQIDSIYSKATAQLKKVA